MRFYEIALWLFVFNLVIGIMGTTGIFSEYNTMQQDTAWIESVNSTGRQINATVPEVIPQDPLTAIWVQAQLLIQGLVAVATIFAQTVLGAPWMLYNMGVPSSLAMPMGIGILFIYVIAIAQLFFGRSVKDME